LNHPLEIGQQKVNAESGLRSVQARGSLICTALCCANELECTALFIASNNMAWIRLTPALFLSCLLWICSAQASPFGELYSWQEMPDFAPRGLTTGPDVAKWLMTLPPPDNLFNAQSSTAEHAEATLSRELFDAEPIGSEPYRFTIQSGHRSPSQTIPSL